jgi:thioredoxin 1
MANDNGVKNITTDNFDQTIGNGVSLVDFWAPWCYPCRMQGPILEKVADQIGDKAQICKLNVDENRDVAMKYGITGIPALFIFKDGEKVQEFVGVQQGETLVSSLQSFM